MTRSETECLLELQELDVELLRSKTRLDELPEKRAILELRSKMREAATLRDKARLLVHKLEGEVKSRQDENVMIHSKLADEQVKVMATTDHRQVQAITREMDGLKRRCDKLDMESFQFVERIDKAQAQVDTIEAHIEALAAKEAALIERYKSVGGEIQGQIAQVEARRAKTAKCVSAATLDRYEAIRTSKGGVAVGRLIGSSCSACHMELPAERVKQLLGGPDLGVCPQCRRLIVVRVEEA